MMDLPPPQPNEPLTIEVQKMDKKEDLTKQIKSLCEKSMQLKDSQTEGKCSLSGRAYFIDICNASNAKEIFSFKIAAAIPDLCQDGFESRNLDDYALLDYHIDSNLILGLSHLLEEMGKGEKRLLPSPGLNIRTFKAIYTIMKDNPDFTPEFTTFTFGGTMADMPPLRDKDGNPNLDFSRAWQDKTIEFFRSNKK